MGKNIEGGGGHSNGKSTVDYRPSNNTLATTMYSPNFQKVSAIASRMLRSVPPLLVIGVDLDF